MQLALMRRRGSRRYPLSFSIILVICGPEVSASQVRVQVLPVAAARGGYLGTELECTLCLTLNTGAKSRWLNEEPTRGKLLGGG